jgi:hypothetical protein
MTIGGDIESQPEMTIGRIKLDGFGESDGTTKQDGEEGAGQVLELHESDG